MEESSTALWYVLKTKPRSEQLVVQGLKSHAIATYLPMVPPRQATWSVRRRSRAAQEPLFPGYVFVKLDLASPNWIRARSYPGVSYILSQDGQPIPLPATVVEGIRERIERMNQAAASGVASFRHGERVEIVEGPLAGLGAVFDRRLSGRERCQVLLSLVHQVVPATISYRALRKLPADPPEPSRDGPALSNAG